MPQGLNGWELLAIVDIDTRGETRFLCSWYTYWLGQRAE